MAVPLIAAAIGAGVGRAGVGMVQNRAEARRRRRLIQEAYRHSADRLTNDQSASRQGLSESLVARGLLQGGDAERIDPSTELNSTQANVTRPGDWKAAGGQSLKIADVMRATSGQGSLPNPIPAPVRAPTTLAGQARADMEREMGFEWRELDMQRRQAEADVKSAGKQGTVDSIGAGINTGINVYSMGQMLGAGARAPAGDYGVGSMPEGMFGRAGGASAIRSVMTGAEDPGNWFAGVPGGDPFGPGSTWGQTHRRTIVGDGSQINAAFGVSQ